MIRTWEHDSDLFFYFYFLYFSFLFISEAWQVNHHTGRGNVNPGQE